MFKKEMEAHGNMSKSKYGQYVISELKLASKLSPDRQGPNLHYIPKVGEGGRIQLLYLDNEIVKNALYAECVWIMPGGKLPVTPESHPHSHEFDEVITFIGSDVEDPYDLGGEIEMWLEGEPQILTRSCLLFIPKGMKHCPLTLKRVDRPIFHTAMGTGGIYLHKTEMNND
jgi:hypothetical protein